MMTPPNLIRLGILGHPIGHTLSPKLHGWLLEQSGLEGTYVPYDIPPADLADVFEQLKTVGIAGLNVTIPHKVTILPLLDGLSPEARLVQAVNTVVFKQGQTVGYNTDVTGFRRALPQSVKTRLPESQVLVLGAGGATRAVLAALIREGAETICLASRSPEKTKQTLAIAEDCRALYQSACELEMAPWERLEDLGDFDLVINTTPVGMSPHHYESPLVIEQLETLPETAVVLDVIYRPNETRLVQMAQSRGLLAEGGLDMLVYQALDSFQLWTGKRMGQEQVAALRQVLLPECQAIEVPVQ